MSEKIENLQTKLASAISRAMENMTFEDVEVVSDENVDPYLGNDKLWAVLPVVAPFSGELVLEVPMECAKMLAEEAYGEIEAEPSFEQMQDLVGEILNTVAGRFLDELVPSGETFQLGLPNRGQGELPDFDEQITSIFLSVGGHYLNTTVFGADFERANNIQNREFANEGPGC